MNCMDHRKHYLVHMGSRTVRMVGLVMEKLELALVGIDSEGIVVVLVFVLVVAAAAVVVGVAVGPEANEEVYLEEYDRRIVAVAVAGHSSLEVVTIIAEGLFFRCYSQESFVVAEIGRAHV